MKIHIACNLNQARSVISAAIIRKFAPEIFVETSGINATTGTSIPDSILKIAASWGLELNKLNSTNTYDVIHDLGDSDIVVAADKKIFLSLNTILNSNFPQSTNRFRIIDLQNYRIAKEIIPIDPFGFEYSQLELELARIAYSTIKFMQDEKLINTSNNVITYSPRNLEEEFNCAKNVINEIINSRGVLVDLNLRAPDVQLWQNFANSLDLDLIEVSGRFENELAKLSALEFSLPTIIASKYECAFPGSVWTSTSLMNSIYEIARKKKVILFTSPLEVNNMVLPDPYLASFFSSENRIF